MVYKDDVFEFLTIAVVVVAYDYISMILYFGGTFIVIVRCCVRSRVFLLIKSRLCSLLTRLILNCRMVVDLIIYYITMNTIKFLYYNFLADQRSSDPYTSMVYILDLGLIIL